MAIYTTFFLSNPGELLGGFPGWKPPLPEPVRREFHNPFTKQLITISTREPEWAHDDHPSALPKNRVIAIQGNYEDYLEGRLPPLVRASEHWAAKGLMDGELQPLLKAIGIGGKLESPLYAPRSSGAVLREFPGDFVPKLIESNQLKVARKWADEMSMPKYTHSITGKKLYNGWTIEQASQILARLVLLARKSVPDQRMFLLIET